MPAVSHGITSFLWAVGFGVYILVGGMAAGFAAADCFMIAVVAAAGIFLYVRVYGQDRPG